MSKASSGFTLVELLLYLALLTLFMTGSMAALYTLWSGQTRLYNQLADTAEQSFVIQKVRWIIGQNVVNSPANDTVGATIELAPYPQISGHYLLNVKNRTLILTEPDGGQIPLTRSTTNIDTFSVSRHLLANNWSTLTLTMTFNGKPFTFTVTSTSTP